MKTWSCKDLQNSVYLGPDEVRACCKRFFVNGERRGDVVLLKQLPTPKRIQAAKQELLAAINAGEETSCTGCPWLGEKEWDPVPETVMYLSMEQHSVCNLQCTYCDTKYWDGRRPTYDAAKLAQEMITEGTVVWGGGEPTVSPEFTELTLRFGTRGIRQRVLSNSVKYSEIVDRALRVFPNFELVTSIDAGTPATYKKVRGVGRLLKVMDNLQRYTLGGKSAERITVKYILTEENSSDDELRAFVELCRRYDLVKCNFQVGCDFREERATLEQLRTMLFLFNRLREAGAGCAFLDDLARIRIADVVRELATDKVVMGEDVADLPTYGVIVYGRGEQADLITKGFCMRGAEYLQVDDSDGPLTDEPTPIVIAASQNYPKIYHSLVVRGLGDRIVREAVV